MRNEKYKFPIRQNVMVWILRIAIACFVFISYYRKSIALHLQAEYFWLGAFYIIASVFILTGGFIKSDLYTRIPAYMFAAVLIVFLVIYIIRFHKVDSWWASHVILLAAVISVSNFEQDKL